MRIVIADRSDLAGNIYRLLLGKFGASLIIRRRFADALPHLAGPGAAGLAIVNSNIFGKKFDEIMAQIEGEKALGRVHKIFLCRENATEEGWAQRLASFPKSHVIAKPFHPDEFATLVRKLVA